MIEIPVFIFPFIIIGICSSIFLFVYLIIKFQNIFLDIKYIKKDVEALRQNIYKLESEITKLKYK